MTFALFGIPFLAGAAAFAVKRDSLRRMLLLAIAGIHALLTLSLWLFPAEPVCGAWLGLDDAGRLFVSILSVLFLCAAVYAVAYLKRSASEGSHGEDQGLFYEDASERLFTGCLLLFLATMTLALESRHLGLLWVAIEATTLASAPLIYFHRHKRSLEATWKYLILCSVGIALALLGTLFVAVAATTAQSGTLSLQLDVLKGSAAVLDAGWLKAGFLLLLVGYGVKAGFAPLHTWLPDAHSEAPSVVSALLSGALLNCAFLGLLRAAELCGAAGLWPFCADLFTLFGLVGLGFAALFILGQSDYKRMLAYSSVEHMGLLAFAVGTGGTAAAMLHAVNHSLTKAALFMTAGLILLRYKTKSVRDVAGMLKADPVVGALLLAGFFAITGMPPFGAFVSELWMFKTAFENGFDAQAVFALFALFVIFLGMARIVVRMVFGAPSLQTEAEAAPAGRALFIAPILALLALTLILGLHVPQALRTAFEAAASVITGGPQ